MESRRSRTARPRRHGRLIAWVPTGASAGTPGATQGLAQLHTCGYRVHGASRLPSITLGCMWATGATAYKEAELGTHSSGLEYAKERL